MARTSGRSRQSDRQARPDGQGGAHIAWRRGNESAQAIYARNSGRVNGAAQRWVAVAHILRPRGNKGEVAAELLTDLPQRLTELREAFLGDSSEKAGPRRIGITACWLSQNHPGQAVFHFEG